MRRIIGLSLLKIVKTKNVDLNQCDFKKIIWLSQFKSIDLNRANSARNIPSVWSHTIILSNSRRTVQKRKRGRPKGSKTKKDEVPDPTKKTNIQGPKKRSRQPRTRISIWLTDDDKALVDWEKMKREQNFTINSVGLKYLLDL